MIYACGNCGNYCREDGLGIYHDEQDNKVAFFCPVCNFKEFLTYDSVLEFLKNYTEPKQDYHEYSLPRNIIREPFRDSLKEFVEKIYSTIAEYVRKKPEFAGDNPTIPEMEGIEEIENEAIMEWINHFKKQLQIYAESKLF